MSNKSTGSHLLVPDEEVKEYSAQLNSYYEMLHLNYLSLLNLPEEISSIKLQLAECKRIFYEVRDLLEEDYGIHPDTSKRLEVPDCSRVLQQLSQWEENFETAKNEYIRRQKDECDAVTYNGEYAGFWKDVRFTLWQVERCLNITRERVKAESIMTFTDVVKTILASAGGIMTPQKIREAIKTDYPQYYGTPSHVKTVEKKQCVNLDHALLAQIYSLVGTNKTFLCDKTKKPMEISTSENLDGLKIKNPSSIRIPEKPDIPASAPQKKDGLKLGLPSPELITEYLCKWETLENYTLQDTALGLLFNDLCPDNQRIEHILLKVSALNDFYSTNIFDTFSVAKHILSQNIDIHLQNGNYEIVNVIAKVSIKGKTKNFYSFASKYCSHHKPELYPIYDSYVEKMLLHYRKHDNFYAFEQSELKNYSQFMEIISKFQRHYGLEEFSLRQIDKFLWLAGKKFFQKNFKSQPSESAR